MSAVFNFGSFVSGINGRNGLKGISRLVEAVG